jgi:hypothetical protein
VPVRDYRQGREEERDGEEDEAGEEKAGHRS